MQNTYNIHFVCRGNEYRSRLAEAFARQLGHPHIAVSSSGIESWNYNLYPRNYLTRPSAAMRDEFKLRQYFAHNRTQTTDELLQAADLIIFMSPDVAHDAAKHFTFNHDKAVTWRVSDIWQYEARRGISHTTPEERVAEARRTAARLRAQCHDFIGEIARLSWVDVVDERNQLRNFKLPVNLVCQKGLWWRGCHIVLTTPNGKFLVEQRSDTITFDPGMLDITLGGGVDAGEEPINAVLRETREEIGLVIKSDALHVIDQRKWDAYHPRYKVNTKVFLTTYHAKLDTNAPLLRLQRKEVAAVHALTYRQILWLIRFHRLKQFGRLKTSYKYFRAIVRASRKFA